jgi:NDP-sugar pyrophosphorylase family protein
MEGSIRGSYARILNAPPPEQESIVQRPVSRLIRPAPYKVRQAVIMAGGKGTRLHPYSATLPKPLMPLGDITILELLLYQMHNAGVTDVVMSINHLGHLIKAYFGDGEKFGLRINYVTEDHPLGTAGALSKVLDDLDDHFFVSNGDLLTTMGMGRMGAAHIANGADATIGTFRRTVKVEFGVIDIDEESHMVAYREKPQNDYLVSMGIYMLSRDAIAPHLKYNEYLDMPNLLLRMKDAQSDIRCYQEECVWLDVGRPDDFALAQKMFSDDRSQFIEP